MKFIKYANQDCWWEWDIPTMTAYNFFGGHHSIDENSLGDCVYKECKDWHELYEATHWCPLETDVYIRDAWLSPDGKFYEAKAHAVTAKDICKVIFGLSFDMGEAEDFLEEHGWVRLTNSLMWDVRKVDLYWADKELTQSQFDSLFDWCHLHKKEFPIKVEM